MNTPNRLESGQSGWSDHADRPPARMITRRRVKPGCRVHFDEALRELTDFAASFPGHLDVHVLYWMRDESCECAIAHRFVDAEVRAMFTSSPEYFRWLRQLRALTDGLWSREDTTATAGSETGAPGGTPPGVRSAGREIRGPNFRRLRLVETSFAGQPREPLCLPLRPGSGVGSFDRQPRERRQRDEFYP